MRPSRLRGRLTRSQDGVRQRYNTLSQTTAPNEAVTEQELIHPVLELLGWADYLPQQSAAGNEDIPDLLLFADAGSKERAAARSNANERVPRCRSSRREQAGSACPWTLETRTPATGLGHRTARYSGICRPPRPCRRTAFGGGF